MAITDKEEGVWGLEQVYNKINQGGIWQYSTEVEQFMVWGKNTHGLLAQNDLVNRSSPVQIPGTTWQYLSHAAAASNDTDSVLVTKTDGTMWGWGNNNNGTLGLNNEVKYSSPIQIGTDTTWGPYMEVTGQSSFAIKTDGTLWAWGKNTSGYGRLGLNDKNSRSSPTQLPGTTWDKIDTYGYCSIATKTDGTLWAWGHGDYGRLGLNANTNYSSPKQVGTDTTWGTSMSGGSNVGGAIKTDGTLWMWGYNNNGQAGQNNRTAYSSPRQVPGTWTKLSCQANSTIALQANGTLWAWGYNNNGNLGLNSQTYYSSPVQIPGNTWSNLISINQSTIAVKTDATMWGWGYQDEGGELGQNNLTKYSSPTQITGDWKQGLKQIGSTYAGFMAIKNL